MIYNLNKNLTDLLGISYEVDLIDLSFTEIVLEESYRTSIFKDEMFKTKIFFFFFFNIYLIIYMVFSISSNIINLTSLWIIFGFAIDAILTIVIIYKKNYRVIRILNIVRFFSLYLLFIVIFAINSSLFSDENLFFFVNYFIIMIYLVLTYFLDYNMVIFIFVPILNSLLILYMKIKSNLTISLFLFFIVLVIAMSILIFILKKKESSEKRKSFFENYKKSQIYIEYIDDLLDSMNKMVITLSNKEVININKCALKYLERKLDYKSIENTLDNLILNHKSEHKNIKTFVDRFFESLKLYSPIPKNSVFQENEKDLKKIIYGILINCNYTSKKFTHLGKFICHSENNCFDISIKRLNQEVLEIMINDISEMMENKQDDYDDNKNKQIKLCNIKTTGSLKNNEDKKNLTINNSRIVLDENMYKSKIVILNNESKIEKRSNHLLSVNSKPIINNENTESIRMPYLMINENNKSIKKNYHNSKISLSSSINSINEKYSKILVVDDNTLIRKGIVNLIKKVLSELKINDFEIVELTDGIDLLYAIMMDKTSKIKCVFSDECMEYLNGSEAVRLIRKMEKNYRIPYYYLVAITVLHEDRRLLDSGFNYIIPHPNSYSEFFYILNKVLIN